MPRIITITSDWNNDDFYIGALKGRLFSECGDCNIVDISHKIQCFNISQAAFVVKNTYLNFPVETIHIVAVNSEPDKDSSHLIVKADNHYFIGCDNGIFALIFEKMPETIIKLPEIKIPGNSTFTSLELFSQAAGKLVHGDDINSLGEKVPSFKKVVPIQPAYSDTVINGSVMYIDSYSNAITNISKKRFDEVGNNRPFEIFVQSNYYKVNKICTNYQEVASGELIALFNSVGLLEIAINNGNAAQLLGLTNKSVVRVKFNDNQKPEELTLTST